MEAGRQALHALPQLRDRLGQQGHQGRRLGCLLLLRRRRRHGLLWLRQLLLLLLGVAMARGCPGLRLLLLWLWLWL